MPPKEDSNEEILVFEESLAVDSPEADEELKQVASELGSMLFLSPEQQEQQLWQQLQHQRPNFDDDNDDGIEISTEEIIDNSTKGKLLLLASPQFTFLKTQQQQRSQSERHLSTTSGSTPPSSTRRRLSELLSPSPNNCNTTAKRDSKLRQSIEKMKLKLETEMDKIEDKLRAWDDGVEAVAEKAAGAAMESFQKTKQKVLEKRESKRNNNNNNCTPKATTMATTTTSTIVDACNDLMASLSLDSLEEEAQATVALLKTKEDATAYAAAEAALADASNFVIGGDSDDDDIDLELDNDDDDDGGDDLQLDMDESDRIRQEAYELLNKC